jgi:hypothetical protein
VFLRVEAPQVHGEQAVGPPVAAEAE